MKEYISKEDALKALCSLCGWDFFACDLCAEYCAIGEVTPADVKPVVRGEWVEIDRDVMGEKTLQCGKCGKRTKSFFEPNFCQNCGADMRERS